MSPLQLRLVVPEVSLSPVDLSDVYDLFKVRLPW